MIGVVLLIGVFTLIYYLAIKPFKYWKEKNVATGKITPLFGDSLLLLLGRESTSAVIQRVYNKLENVRYVGMYNFFMPILVLKSPDLIKQLCVKNFDHFLNHNNPLPEELDEIWSRNLFILKGQKWKHMRGTLSPSFTSSKMKAMFVLIRKNSEIAIQHFLEKNQELVEVEMKDMFTRYTNDVIASAAFGIKIDSLADRDNEFYRMGREVSGFNPPFWKKIIFIIYIIFPSVAKFIKVELFGSGVKAFFVNLLKDTIKIRQEQNIKRPDMLGLLLEAKKSGELIHIENEEDTTSIDNFATVKEYLEMKPSPKEINEIDIASQMFIFFSAGFETVATAMLFTAYELAVNHDIQKRLIKEIDENMSRENGTPSYDAITKMVYMDMVISESLRKWPINVSTDRVVTKPYSIPAEFPDETPMQLDVDDKILIPIFAIHRDPKYYPEPEKFDPERFSPTNRENINPYSYLPFGVGPRNCIGSRFALLEIKTIFFYLLSHFEIVPVKKTQIPLQISKSSFNLSPGDTLPLGLRRRNR